MGKRQASRGEPELSSAPSTSDPPGALGQRQPSGGWWAVGEPAHAQSCSASLQVSTGPLSGEGALHIPTIHCRAAAAHPITLPTCFRPQPSLTSFPDQDLLFLLICPIPSISDPILTTTPGHCCTAINGDADNEQLSDNRWLKRTQAKLPVIPCQWINTCRKIRPGMRRGKKKPNSELGERLFCAE